MVESLGLRYSQDSELRLELNFTWIYLWACADDGQVEYCASARVLRIQVEGPLPRRCPILLRKAATIEVRRGAK